MCINRPRLLTFRSLFFCAFQIHWLATWRWWQRLWFPPCVHCASSSEPSSSCSCCKDAFETLADFPPFDMIRPRWPWRNELGQSENESESETHTWSSEIDRYGMSWCSLLNKLWRLQVGYQNSLHLILKWEHGGSLDWFYLKWMETTAFKTSYLFAPRSQPITP